MKTNDKPSILLVEDEATLSEIIVDTFENEGFTIFRAGNGSEGLKMFFDQQPDLIIADVMMPEIDGFEMVGKIRKTDKITPVVFLTARSAIEDLVSGFELGANDYLRKPFKMQELIVRVKALLNRSIINKPVETVFKLGNYLFDSVSQILQNGSRQQELSHLENEILKRLCLNINNIVEVHSLLTELWYDDSFYNRNSLHGYIHKLRKLLAEDKEIRILNVRGIGYKLVCAIE